MLPLACCAQGMHEAGENFYTSGSAVRGEVTGSYHWGQESDFAAGSRLLVVFTADHPVHGSQNYHGCTFEHEGSGPGAARQPVTVQALAQLPKAGMAQLLPILPHAVQVSNLHVADASLFPTSAGVNPMVTVAAMSYLVAQGLAQQIRDGAVPHSQKDIFMSEE